MTENRHGFVVNTHVTQPGGTAECDAALEMVTTLPLRAPHITLGADKGYDRVEFVASLRAMEVTPHVAQNIHARRHTSAIDGRTTRHAGYAISQVCRKRIEEVFGWVFTFMNAVYNLVRLRTLMTAGVCP
jgi:hypothetical protein